MIHVTPIAISANSQQYACSITENLCQCYCLNADIQPTADVKFSVASQQVVNGMTYLTILAKGSITYLPRGANRCCCRPLTKMFAETFDCIFAGAKTSAPTLTVGSTLDSAANVKCNGNVFAYNLLTPVTIAFATASEESAAVAASKVK
uniref:Uncharacterized protein n=1 Tax=Myoviridae sp. ctByu2 TaxID=2827668 RepID=A0A8S5S9W5_9CAUD|nr:MAG TPA: hypothetical protein [Myoviridae sp. ctByu2]